MARFAFVLGIWVLAIALGILGYQCLTWYFYQDWPVVSVGFGWQEVRVTWQKVFGDFWLVPSQYRWQLPPGDLYDALNWLAEWPIAPAGLLLSYILFLLSDTLRGRLGRRGG